MAPRSEVQIQARYAILTPAKMTLQKDFHTSIQTQSRNRVSPLNSSNHNEISKLKKKSKTFGVVVSCLNFRPWYVMTKVRYFLMLHFQFLGP